MELYFNEYDQATLEKAESLLFNGNGYLGVRGNLEEDYYDFFNTNRETFINGFYELKDIAYPEKMTGFIETAESMVSVPDGQTTLIWIGDEPFSLKQGTVLEHARKLDLTKGQTVRKITWLSPKRQVTKITIRRLASFTHPNLFVMQYDFERVNHDLPIKLETHINFYPIRTIDHNDPRMNHDELKIQVERLDLEHQELYFSAARSGCQGSLKWRINLESSYQQKANQLVITSEVTGNHFEKVFSYKTGEVEHIGLEKDFEKLAQEQADYLADFWRGAKISIDSDQQIEESVNYGTYALLQSVGKDGKTSIAAKGLSGSGYEGHYFWDTEMYLFPVFLHLNPKIAENLLNFRVATLAKAKENRALIGYQSGALYPWRTISGVESSAFFEAGSAQHHINADIAHAFISYYQYTKDLTFMLKAGFEVLLETSRVFREIGYLKNDQFHIDKVTGPDEYTVLVNDNHYTNKMVQDQFNWLGKLAHLLEANYPSEWLELSDKLGLSSEELAQYQELAEKMSLPFDEQRGIIAQDRDFLNKAQWPYAKSETKYPLLLNYHPLVIYRYQITKQADAVLPLMLFPDAYPEEVTAKTVAYYDDITTHDSSLSYSAYAILYSRLGEQAKSYQYFMENARIDLDNSHGNTKDGIHTASIGGTFMTILYGFCDLKIVDGKLTVTNNLPAEIQSIKMKTYFQGDLYQLEVNQREATITKVTT